MSSHYTKLSSLYNIKEVDCLVFIYELTLPDDMIPESVIEHIRWCLKACDTLGTNSILMFNALLWECHKLVSSTPHSHEKKTIVAAKLEAALDVYSAYFRDTDQPKKLYWASILSVMAKVQIMESLNIIDKVLDIKTDYDYDGYE